MDADARTRTRGRARGEKALIEGVVRVSLLVLDRDAREEEEEEEEEDPDILTRSRSCRLDHRQIVSPFFVIFFWFAMS